MNEPEGFDPGVKKTTVANWQDQDESAATWCKMTSVAKTKEEWVNFFQQPALDSTVPLEIAKLMEVARAAMIYSWYFYPLATLGVEQCHRLLDMGTRIRCERAGISTKRATKSGVERDTSFKENTFSLVARNIIAPADVERWDASRFLRNMSSHPTHRSIYDPGQAQGILEFTTELLNDLFR
jgi:hypothetical protein